MNDLTRLVLITSALREALTDIVKIAENEDYSEQYRLKIIIERLNNILN